MTIYSHARDVSPWPWRVKGFAEASSSPAMHGAWRSCMVGWQGRERTELACLRGLASWQQAGACVAKCFEWKQAWNGCRQRRKGRSCAVTDGSGTSSSRWVPMAFWQTFLVSSHYLEPSRGALHGYDIKLLLFLVFSYQLCRIFNSSGFYELPGHSEWKD